MDNFLDSRYDFLAALSTQTSVTTGESLYDKKGTLARAAMMGLPKNQIAAVLDRNPIFRANVNLLSDSSQVTNPIEKAKLLEFKDFYDSLQNMKDPGSKVTLRSELSSMLSAKYKDIDAALLLVEDEGSAAEIFDALLDNEKWKEDARDYLTKDYVDLPSKDQRAKWASFKEIVDAINDLKYFEK